MEKSTLIRGISRMISALPISMNCARILLKHANIWQITKNKKYREQSCSRYRWQGKLSYMAKHFEQSLQNPYNPKYR